MDAEVVRPQHNVLYRDNKDPGRRLRVALVDPRGAGDRHVQGDVWHVNRPQEVRPYACPFETFAKIWEVA
jgi:hypothetical protein